MRIQTHRLLLRDLVPDDRAAFVAYQTDPRYRKLYGIGEGEEKRAQELFDLFVSWQREKPRRNFQLGIVEPARGRLCGCAGLRMAGAPDSTAVLGLELTPDDWGRYRLAIEAATALINYGFETLGLKRVMGDTASGNRRVERLARWFGADIITQRPGRAWMAARGWVEVEWSLSCEKWAEITQTEKRFTPERPG